MQIKKFYIIIIIVSILVIDNIYKLYKLSYKKPIYNNYGSVNVINKDSSTKTNEPKKLLLGDFQIGGLMLEQPISDVIKLFGNPQEIRKTVVYSEKQDKENWNCYYYPGISLEVSKDTGKVYDIVVERKGLITHRGIEVGNSEKKVIQLYGKGQKVGNNLNYQKYDNSKFATYSMDFIIENQKVKRIQIYYAWD